MTSVNMLAIVLAGGEGSRLRPLTAERAKPAVPFANGRRIIDFVLSNLVNSGFSSIYVLAQYKPQSLIRHIDGAWGSTHLGDGSFVSVVLPQAGERFLGTADAVFQNLHLVERHRPGLVAVFAADHVYRMDVRQMVSFHIRRAADVCVAAVPVPVQEASSFGVIGCEQDGRIHDFQEKPQKPSPLPFDPTRAFASMGNYLFTPGALVDLLYRAKERSDTDFGKHVLPHAVQNHRTFAYDFSDNHVPGLGPYEQRSYWRDVGTLDAYAAARWDVLGPEPCLDLANAKWPIRGAILNAERREGALHKTGSKRLSARRSVGRPLEVQHATAR